MSIESIPNKEYFTFPLEQEIIDELYILCDVGSRWKIDDEHAVERLFKLQGLPFDGLVSGDTVHLVVEELDPTSGRVVMSVCAELLDDVVGRRVTVMDQNKLLVAQASPSAVERRTKMEQDDASSKADRAEQRDAFNVYIQDHIGQQLTYGQLRQFGNYLPGLMPDTMYSVAWHDTSWLLTRYDENGMVAECYVVT